MGTCLRKIARDNIGTAITLLLIAAGIFFLLQNPVNYQIYARNNQGYERGKVLRVIEEDLDKDPLDITRSFGLQRLLVLVQSGELKGKEVTVDNYLTQAHNIYLQSGARAVFCVETREGIEPYISVYNYDRTPGIYLLFSLLLLSMILVGKGKGFRSAVGLLFTFVMIVCFMVPMIYQGYNPILLCMVTIVITTTVSLLLLNRWTLKTWIAITATSIGTAITAVIFLLSSAVLHLSGFNTGEAEELILIAQNTGLHVKELLFVGIMIASLGAVMDVAMSLTSALLEMAEMKPDISPKELLISGINIGKDMIGTMSNTLILAFTGGALTMILVLFSYGIQYNQIMSSDYIAIELAQGISGTVAVILTVPVTTLLCAAAAGKRSKN